MSKKPPFLFCTGFDPSGAGVLADCKTFEQHQVYGLAIITATQTENEFYKLEWIDLTFVLELRRKLFANHTIKAVKSELFLLYTT
jgi:hydroxymethylpyrimidine/phosphomethylpyrimidine kinase